MSKRKLGWVLINSKSRDPLSSIENLEKCLRIKFYVKTPNNQNNQDIAHHAHHCSLNNLCCKQVMQTKTFQSYRTKETFQIFHKLTCKSENLLYLLQCRICQLQYVGKSETPLNIRLNNHRKDAKSQASILARKLVNN